MENLIARINALEQTVAQEKERNSEQRGKMYARIEAVEKGQLAVQINLSNIEKVCQEIKSDVKILKEKPIKRYEGLVNSILQWAALALLGAISIFK